MVMSVRCNYYTPDFYFLSYFVSLGILLERCLCTMCMAGAHGGQKGRTEALDLEVQTVVSDHVGAGDQAGTSARAAHCS